jgi:hypothetical protein
MTWTINNPPSSVKNKSKEVVQVCLMKENYGRFN